MRKTLFGLAAAVIVAMAGGHASAQQSLKDVGYVTQGLIAVGMAYEISEVCGEIDARTLRGLAYLNQLRSHAKGLGFTNAQIEAYIDDKAEQNRLEAIARDRLAQKGAKSGDPASYCAVGRAEMANGSAIGTLLR